VKVALRSFPERDAETKSQRKTGTDSTCDRHGSKSRLARRGARINQASAATAVSRAIPESLTNKSQSDRGQDGDEPRPQTVS
jgi:hypothetical protein